MGIGRGIAWALGLVPESNQKTSKRMYKEHQKQYDDNKQRIRIVISELELYGFKKTIDLEVENFSDDAFSPEEIRKVWSLNSNIKDKETGKTYSEYFSFENNEDSSQLKQDLLDKEKEILELKLKLAEIEKIDRILRIML